MDKEQNKRQPQALAMKLIIKSIQTIVQLNLILRIPASLKAAVVPDIFSASLRLCIQSILQGLLLTPKKPKTDVSHDIYNNISDLLDWLSNKLALMISVLYTFNILVLFQTWFVAAIHNKPSHQNGHHPVHYLQRRQSRLFTWAAIGDSFAAGTTSGGDSYIPGDTCHRSTNSFIYQMHLDPELPRFPGYQSDLHFLACAAQNTGIDEMIRSQVDAMPTSSTLVVVSAGADQIGLAEIVWACILSDFPDSPGRCNNAIQNAYQILDVRSATFQNSMLRLYDAIFAKIPIEEITLNARVIHPLYPNFFNIDTDWCEGQSMFHGKNLSKALRRQLAEVIYTLNAAISLAANRWLAVHETHRIIGALKVASQDALWDGHRFCENGMPPGWVEPSAWFSPVIGNGNRAVAGDFVANCDGVDKGNWENVGKCAVSKWYGLDPARQGQSIDVDPNLLHHTFHPKLPGHRATKDAVFKEFKDYPADKFAPIGQKLRIMPIGDSITYGYLSTTGNGYRGPLYEILSKADNSIEFVGTKHDGNMVNNAHNGYPGWRVNEISAEIFSASSTDGRSPNAIVDQKPNVILLHICTNDLNSDSLFEPDTASERVGVLIDRLFSAAPDVTIIVAQIIPANDPEVRARILRHNGRLEMEVARRRGAGRKILSAILPLNYKTVHLSDGLHPNDAGYQKMAEGWAAALADASRRGWISPADTGVDALKPFNGGS